MAEVDELRGEWVGLLEEGLREEGFNSFLVRTKSSLPPLPNVSITYQDVVCEIDVQENKIVSSESSADLQNLDKVKKPKVKKAMTKLRMLDNVSGQIDPGTMTLVLAPPGHGKSTLLRTLAGKVDVARGKLVYNGDAVDELQKKNINLSKLGFYVDQVDVNFPTLTVRETLQFAHDNAVIQQKSSKTLPPHLAQRLARLKVDVVIRMLGLSKCSDTIVSMVSGGERKRVSIGEALVTNSRMLFLDEVSSGLDTNVCIDVFMALRDWSKIMEGSVVAAVLQPPIEVYNQFDKIILLREGRVVYDGPRTEVLSFVESAYGIKCPANKTEPDFLLEFISTPQHVIDFCREQNLLTASFMERKADTLNTNFMAQRYNASKQLKDLQTHQAKTLERYPQGMVLEDQFTKDQYACEYAHSIWRHTLLNIQRQARLNARNKRALMFRTIRVMLVGLVISTVFYQINTLHAYILLGLVTFFAITFGFNNLSELPVAFEQKNLVLKQRGQGLYPITSFILSAFLMGLPFLAIEAFVSANMVYWICGFAPYIQNYLMFMVLLFCFIVTMNALFRLVAYACSSLVMTNFVVTIVAWSLTLFGGFLITKGKISMVFIALYYCSPVSWMLSAIAINEYHSDRYTLLMGNVFLRQWEMVTDDNYVWSAIFAMSAQTLALLVASGLFLKYQSIPFARGTNRQMEDDSDDDVSQEPHFHGEGKAEEEVDAEVDTEAGLLPEVSQNGSSSFARQGIPFKPVSFAFRNVEYWVEGDKEKDPPKQLLFGIHGICKPGTCTALMGASGAGKTTLLDVIGGKKNRGIIKGDILVNGQNRPEWFDRIMAYVEQQDLHCPTATVREALLFSLELRRNFHIEPAQRMSFINSILEVLELTDVADSLIGNAQIPGLSPHQLRRVTIGVELTSNPSLLFLDEPTTGLDSRSAYLVCHAIRNVAATGRTVICTIHQPSNKLFYMFDNLLLLNSRGRQIYFGPIGDHGRDCVGFFENISGTKCTASNPATWALSVTRWTENGIDFPVEYQKSDLYKSNALEITNQSAHAVAAEHNDDSHKPGFLRQYAEVQKRAFRSHWRNTSFTVGRMLGALGIGIFLGAVYFQLSSVDVAGTHSKVSLMFISVFMCILQQNICFPVFFEERALFYRERMNKMYSPYVYTLATFIVELPYLFFASFFCCTIIYLMVGLSPSVELYWMYFLPYFLLACFFSSCGQLLAAASPTQEIGGVANGIVITCSVLFSGLFINGESIGLGYRWLFYINPIHYALEAMVMPQFYCVGAVCPTIFDDSIGSVVTQASYVSTYLGYGYGFYSWSVFLLACIVVTIKMLTVIAHTFIQFARR